MKPRQFHSPAFAGRVAEPVDDASSEVGAKQLAQQIRAAWARVGVAVEVVVEPSVCGGFSPRIVTPISAVRAR